MKYTEKVYDVVSGKETIIERDFTKEELLKIEAEQKRLKEIEQNNKAREEARIALLNKLGITPEEAAVLLG